MSTLTNIPNIFIGRADEQARFRQALQQIQTKAFPPVFGRGSPRIPPFVFLIAGEGGMGKTMLARQLMMMAEQDAEFRGRFQVVWLDWKRQQERDPRLSENPPDPVALLENIFFGLRASLTSADLKNFEKARDLRGQIEDQIHRARIQPHNENEQIAHLGKLADKTFRWLATYAFTATTTLATLGNVNLPPEVAKDLTNYGIDQASPALGRYAHEARALVERIAKSRRNLDLYTSPERLLAHDLADDIRTASERQPLVLILDNYDVADRNDTWLREIILHAGAHVVWIITDRKDLAYRAGGYAYDPHFAPCLCAYRLTSFDAQEIESYLGAYARERKRESFTLSPNSINTIKEITRGIPEALRIFAELHIDQQLALQEIQDHHNLITLMKDRQLSNPSPADLRCIYALAIVRKPDAQLLSAMFQTASLSQLLVELQSRHSYISVVGMCLEENIAYFLRRFLLIPVLRADELIRKLNDDAIAYLTTRRAAHEKRINNLDACPKDSQWQETLLALTHHCFWLGEEEGWSVCLPAFVLGMNQHREFAAQLVQVAARFEHTLPFMPEGQARLKKMRRMLNKKHPEPRNLLNILEGAVGSGTFYTEFESFWVRIATDQFGKVPSEHRSNLQQVYPQLIHLLEGKTVQLVEAKAFLPPSQSSQKITRVEQLAQATTNTRIAFEQIVLKYPDLLPIDHTRGNLERAFGLYAEASRTYQNALRQHPNDATLHIGLGRVHYETGYYEDAKQHFLQAQELNPQSAESYLGMGDLLTVLGQYDKALDAYTQAREREPENNAVHCGLGTLYHHKNDLDQARGCYERALQCDSQSAEAYCGLGNVHSDIGNWDQALDAYHRALRLSQNLNIHGIISARMATCWRKRGDTDSFNSLAERVHAAITGTHISDYDRARVEAILGNTAAALERLQTALVATPGWRLRARHDLDFADLRHDPQFRKLVEE